MLIVTEIIVVMIPITTYKSVFLDLSQCLIKEYSPKFVDIHNLLPWKGRGIQAGAEVTQMYRLQRWGTRRGKQGAAFV